MDKMFKIRFPHMLALKYKNVVPKQKQFLNMWRFRAIKRILEIILTSIYLA